MNLETLNKKIADLELLRDNYAKHMEQVSNDRKKREIALKVKKVLRMMETLGVTLQDVAEHMGTEITTTSPNYSGYKVPVKYRDPETGDTWTGRGKQPRWLQSKLAHGAHVLDEFKLPEAA